jgi:ubiquinone/menaquinone biosynthesis C-methylase UbiE
MLDSVSRFSSRVENYSKYRPGYPPAIIDLLIAKCRLTSNSIIADIGSGTGILSELFLINGNKVFAVEPNKEMRAVAERALNRYSKFISVKGRAESTTLPDSSVDFVTAGQAFHWFDQRDARKEFLRILKPSGFVVLAWNERRIDSTPFHRMFEDFLIEFGTDYQRVRHENAQKDLDPFFAPQVFQRAAFENVQEFDLDGLKGRVLSASYMPEPSDANYEAMIERLREIFLTHQKNGKVSIEYDTRLYYGHLK